MDVVLTSADVVHRIRDSMGTTSSRNRRCPSVGCWRSKSLDGEEEYRPASKTLRPNHLKLEVRPDTGRKWIDLPTPSSDQDCAIPETPLAQSSNEKLVQIIRCFPFPTPRSSPRESPRLKRKNNNESGKESKEGKDSGKETQENQHEEEDRVTHDVYRHAVGQLVQVSVETMAITALPKESIDCWLKERLKKWIQLSGHEGSIIPASSNSLYKKQTGMCMEGAAYRAIQDDVALKGFAPRFFQQIDKNNETFIEIEDLLSQFSDPSQTAIMDIKIGTRTFLESEVSNMKKRKDLYEKMYQIDPFEPTEEERLTGEITKLRYMQFRERESSTAELGFRIEAAKSLGGSLEKNFKKVRTPSDVANVLIRFFGSERQRVVESLLVRLKAMRSAIENSTFFANHEVVGSSLLVLFDKEKASVWMIDFAKASPLPKGRTLSHRAKWTPGNAEDGYLVGIDNLVKIFEELRDSPIPAKDRS